MWVVLALIILIIGYFITFRSKPQEYYHEDQGLFKVLNKSTSTINLKVIGQNEVRTVSASGEQLKALDVNKNYSLKLGIKVVYIKNKKTESFFLKQIL